MVAILSEKLTKVYALSQRRIEALKGIDLAVDEGSVFSLLGRNGSGKTTFVRIASTILEPTSGRIEVLGYDVVKEPWPIRRRIAVLPQEGRPIDHTTPREAVMAYLLMRGWPLSDAKIASRKMIEELGLEEYSGRPAWSLSGGLKRRVLLAMVLATEADLLFLDEPTLGLDPHMTHDIWRHILMRHEKGTTIFLSTNNLEEAEVLSDMVAIIDEGLILARGSVKELVAMVPGRYRVDVHSKFDKAELESHGVVYGSSPAFIVYTDKKEAESLLAEALARGAKASIRPVGLEDAFIHITGGPNEVQGAA